MGGGLARYDHVIVGAGPAGVAAAYALSTRGYRVLVVEASRKPALKPCGWAIPDIGDLPLRIPRDTVLATIRGATLLVDGEEAFDVRGWLRGFIVDKPAFLEAIAADAGVDIEYGSPYLPSRGAVRLGSAGLVDLKPSLLAMGSPLYPGEKILAVEAEARAGEPCDISDRLYIDFDTRLVGYYWAFPHGANLQVGVGGFAGYEALRRLLDSWVERRLPCRVSLRGPVRGAPLAVGGLRLRRLHGIPLAGESAGFVLPLTGEGIRPSILSGHAAGEAIARGEDPLQAQGELAISRAIRIQRKVLEKVKAMDPGRRSELLKSIPARVHAEVALGTLRRGVIVRELASKPRLAGRILRLILGG